MKLTFEKKTGDKGTNSNIHSGVERIKIILGSQNKIESRYINLFPQSSGNLITFFKSFIGPGDEVLTVGPTSDKFCQTITSCDASYFEFYEKPVFLPDSLGLIGKIKPFTKMILLGNPNRFTGVVYSEKEIEDILNASKNIIIVLDESTYESSNITAINLIKKYDNLYLFRSHNNWDNNCLKYFVGSPIAEKNNAGSELDAKYGNTKAFDIMYDFKKAGNKSGRVKDARQEMLYLSIRLRMFGIECFLNPDYSLVINSVNFDELLMSFNEIGISCMDLSSFPGLTGNILIKFDIDTDVMSIIEIFENMDKEKQYNKLGRNRLTIYQPSGSYFEIENRLNYENIYGDKLKSNMIF